MTASAQTQQGIVKTKGRMVPNVARSYNNIGLVYDSQGDYAHALEYFQKALDIRRKVYGEGHPKVVKMKELINTVIEEQRSAATETE